MNEIKIDCVALQHEGGARIYEATKDMTEAEEAAYWAERDREFFQIPAGDAAAVLAERRAAIGPRMESYGRMALMHEEDARVHAGARRKSA